jgi:hypothetical protein
LGTHDANLRQARDVAAALLGAPVEVQHLLAGGRNSRIYRVRCGAGRDFALKQYPSGQDDPRDRLSTEVRALRLMERGEIEVVPRVVHVDRDHGFALFTWIDGSRVVEVAAADIDAAVAFLRRIHGLRRTPWAREQPLAAEACLAGGEIGRQICERLARLRSLSDECVLQDFLESSFVPAFERWERNARRRVQLGHLDFAAELPQEWRSLVPSDFGFHNSLRLADGFLAFLDFEYFGWDDPVKLTADILLHPGSPLAARQQRRFRQAAAELYGEDPNFRLRLDAYIPLFGLRWVLILLNEFIPERWRRRVLAGATEDWNAAKRKQLGRATDMLASLPHCAES